eukprot:gene2806-3488_t
MDMNLLDSNNDCCNNTKSKNDLNINNHNQDDVITTTTPPTTTTITTEEVLENKEEHIKFMQLALIEAEKALKDGEVPVGCVIVHNGKVIATGCNKTNIKKNGTRHAEFEAIDSLFLGLQRDEYKDTLLSECSLYVTVEPCIMCAAALQLIHIKDVYFGCYNDKFGGNGAVYSLHTSDEIENGKPYKAYSGLLKEEAIFLLQRFYFQENKKAPVPNKRKRVDPVLKKSQSSSSPPLGSNDDENNNNNTETTKNDDI